MEVLAKADGHPKRLHLKGIRLDDGLIWHFMESNLERLLIQNRDLEPNGSAGFGHLFKLWPV
jgi:hypothetical protein